MKIVGTTNSQISCIWSTIGLSIAELGRSLGLETIIYDRQDFLDKKIQYESEEVIFIFEAGTPQHAGYTMKDMKAYFPNSKFVCLSSDAIIYKEVLGYDQLDYNYVDIFLDVEDKAVDYVTSKYKNVIGGKWLWTISCGLGNYITDGYFHDMAVLDRGLSADRFDFILVAILSGEYRQNLKNFIMRRGFTITNGGGCGHEDNDIPRLISHYLASGITLGTTSHNNPKIRGMKGFRDWIGPLTGAPLIYDDYPQAVAAYGDAVPYYDYNDFESILVLRERLLDKEVRHDYLYKQRSWISNNTIELQLNRILKSHGIL